MNLGETMLVLGALVIFSLVTLYLNDAKLDNETRLYEVEFETTAIGIAQSYLEEAQSLSFDEVLTNPAFAGSIPADFTAIASLGADAGETSSANFDDVDDFNNFSSTINTQRIDYNVSIFVSYADTTTITPGLGIPSLLKIMTVTVTSAYFADSLKFDYLYCYR